MTHVVRWHRNNAKYVPEIIKIDLHAQTKFVFSYKKATDFVQELFRYSTFVQLWIQAIRGEYNNNVIPRNRERMQFNLSFIALHKTMAS